jgi:hypothetical protein
MTALRGIYEGAAATVPVLREFCDDWLQIVADGDPGLGFGSWRCCGWHGEGVQDQALPRGVPPWGLSAWKSNDCNDIAEGDAAKFVQPLGLWLNLSF